mmetsp:Transcript_23587/g.20948  ORF Transcript_23587/g.20948 Transcript_23587/m.20948 type:complete len:98 (+) Transcript_23587:764-1057(+)
MIIKMIGTPDHESWEGFSRLPDYPKLIFPKSEGVFMKDVFLQEYPDIVTDFLRKLLVLNPEKRLTTREALQDPYFTESPLLLEDLALDLSEVELSEE